MMHISASYTWVILYVIPTLSANKNISNMDQYLIDWKTDAEHLPMKFGLKKVSDSELQRWKLYVSIIIREQITRKEYLLTLRSVIRSLHKTKRWSKTHEYTFLDSICKLLTPMGKFRLETWQKGILKWVKLFIQLS